MTDDSYNTTQEVSDFALVKMIGAFIKHHRLLQNKTQKELAFQAGVSRSTLSLLEKGEKVNLSTLIQVLRVLNLLYILDVFKIETQVSPIVLAKLEKQKKQRASNKDKQQKPKSDW